MICQHGVFSEKSPCPVCASEKSGSSDLLCHAEKQCLAISQLTEELMETFAQLAPISGKHPMIADVSVRRNHWLLEQLLSFMDGADMLQEEDQWIIDLMSEEIRHNAGR